MNNNYDKYDEMYEERVYKKHQKVKPNHKTKEELEAKYGKYGCKKLNKRDKKNGDRVDE